MPIYVSSKKWGSGFEVRPILQFCPELIAMEEKYKMSVDQIPKGSIMVNYC